MIAGERDRVFLVSKVWPSHVQGTLSILTVTFSSLDPSGGTHLLILLRAAVIARGRRQLQYGRALTGDQSRDHHDLAAREFECVVMQVRVVHVDLPELGNFVVHARSAEQAESALVLDIFFKSQFRARK